VKRPDGFVLGLFAVVLLAWLLPSLGASEGPLRPKLLGSVGVGIIYFGQGLSLTLGQLRQAGSALKVHALIQLCTFLFFPLLGVVLSRVLGPALGAGLALGVFFLCVLPSTVSSSVTLTALAQGNTSVALFNATASSLLGIVVTPLWLSLGSQKLSATLPFGEVVRDLVLSLALPFALGQLLQPWWGSWARSRRRAFQNLDRSIILLLVFASFAESFHTGAWLTQGWAALLLAGACSVGLFAFVMVCLRATCSALNLTRDERIAALFCGVTKSLATGVPIAHIVFGQSSQLGPVLLPLLVYHPLQLLVCSVLASKWAREAALQSAGESRQPSA
jgi:solute carrier family 10 (sodium/bile acid cotransporter), member 7